MSSEMPSLDQHNPTPGQHNYFHFVLDALIRHWMVVVGCAVIACMLGYGFSVSQFNADYKYAAQGNLVIKQSYWQNPEVNDVSTNNAFGKTTPSVLLQDVVMTDLAHDIAVTLIQEDIVNAQRAGDITSEEEIDAQVVKILMQLDITPINEKNEIIVIASSRESNEDARRIVDVALRALIEHTQLQRRSVQDSIYGTVKNELTGLRKELDISETYRWKVREEMGFETNEDVSEDLKEKRRLLNQSRIEIGVLEQKIEEKDKALVTNSINLPEAIGNVTDNVIQNIFLDIEELVSEDIQKSVVWTENSPQRKALRDAIEEKREAADMAIAKMSDSPIGGTALWQERQNLLRQKVDMETKLAFEEVRQATLNQTLTDMVEKLPALNEQSFGFEQLNHKITQLRLQYSKMLQVEFEIKQAIARDSATVKRHDATVLLSASYNSPQTIKTTILFALVGLLLGFGLSMGMELNDTSIKSHDDISRYLNLEVIGMIPKMIMNDSKLNGKAQGRGRKSGAYVVSTDESLVDASIVTQHDPKSPVSEAYRSLRTNFQFATLKKNPKTIMITSSVPAEGKTTTAVNFAVTMADRGIRVLILDTDLRRPNVHRVLKMDRDVGLSDVLRDQVSLADVIRPTRTENLSMISSGRVPPNPSELIGSERMKNLMDELGGSFDLVVCDAPSVLVVTDPVLLATFVDTVILVVSAGNARRETIQRAKALLETANPHISGVVLNALKATARHYYYYYYYYDDHAPKGRRKIHNFGK